MLLTEDVLPYERMKVHIKCSPWFYLMTETLRCAYSTGLIQHCRMSHTSRDTETVKCKIFLFFSKIAHKLLCPFQWISHYPTITSRDSFKNTSTRYFIVFPMHGSDVGRILMLRLRGLSPRSLESIFHGTRTSSSSGFPIPISRIKFNASPKMAHQS